MSNVGSVEDAINRYFVALQSGDADELKACFTRDAQWIAPGRLSNSGVWVGPDDIVDRFFPIAMARMQPGTFTTELISLTVGTANAVVEWRSTATTLSGASYENAYIAVFVVTDGGIAQVREYFDTQQGEVLFA